MQSVFHHPTLGDITISCTRRARRISLSVRPTGAVRLSFPPYVAEHRALEFLESKRNWVLKAKEKYTTRNSHSPLTKDEIEQLRREAKQHLPARVELLAQQHGLHYGKVTIRASRTKWGSCTAQNNISLSLFLMTLPQHLRDYVIIHELCHTVYHNHSQQFHALVDRISGGNEKHLAKELRQYTIN